MSAESRCDEATPGEPNAASADAVGSEDIALLGRQELAWLRFCRERVALRSHVRIRNRNNPTRFFFFEIPHPSRVVPTTI